MRSKLIAVTILIFATSNLHAASFFSAPPRGNWAKVQALSEGASLAVGMKQEGLIHGEFIRLSEDSVFLSVDGTQRVYPKESVAEVRLLRMGSRGKNAAIAGGILFGLGFGIGYGIAPKVADDDTLSGGARAQTGAGVGAVFGGIAAGIAALKKPRVNEELIYAAR